MEKYNKGKDLKLNGKKCAAVFAKNFRELDRSTVYRGFTRIDVVEVEQTTSAGQKLHVRREVEHHGEGAAVLAFDPLRKTAILVRQLRIPVEAALSGFGYLLEVPAGLIDHAGDGAAETVRREALEEAGLRRGDLIEVAAPYSMPGLSTERVWLYLAEIDMTRDRVASGGGLASEQEDIDVIEISLAELARMADAGEIGDMKTFALVQTLRLKRPALFG